MQFCGIAQGVLSWWPQTGYRSASFFGGPTYGEPEGQYREVIWLVAADPQMHGDVE